MELLGIEYSIKEHLVNNDIPSIMHSTELKPPKVFPMSYVINAPSNHSIIAKGRETMEALYNFEIVLFCETKEDLYAMRSKITKILNFDDFDYYDENGLLTDKKFNTDEFTGVFASPAFVINVENTSNYYQVSFDFGVRTTYHKN